MELVMLLYPMSLIVLCIISNTILYIFRDNYYYFIILCICSILKLITIKPILKTIEKFITTVFKKEIDCIKHNIRESFVVEGNLTNDKQAIYIIHPHGMCSLSHVFHIATNITNWPYKNIKGVMHFMLEYVPFFLDLIDEKYTVDSTYTSMKSNLIKGESMSMCLGNFTEGKYTDEHRITAIVKNRIGIFKMAIETGVPIIPILSYGEQSKFKQFNTYGILEYLSTIFGIQFNCPDFWSIYDWIEIYRSPLKDKIYTHIGQPIDVGKARKPSFKEIIDLRDKYIDALRALYKETKPKDYEDDIIII